MSFEGMDPDKVIAIAQRLAEQQRRIAAVAQTVSVTMSSARGSWRGPDVDRFLADWAGKHQAQLLSASAAVGELAIKAYANAQQQVQTSNDYAGGTAAPVGNPTPILSQLTGIHLSTDTHGQWGVSASAKGASTLAGIPVSGAASAFAGARGGAGAHFDLDGNQLDAGGQAHGFAGARADASGQIGNQYLMAKGDAHALAGVQGSAEADLKAGPDGTSLALGAAGLAGAQATAHGFVGNRYASVSGSGEAFAGAKASVDSKASIGPNGESFSGGIDAFAGAKAGADGSVNLGGVSVGTGVSAETGVGIEAEGSESFTSDNVGFSVNLGGSLLEGVDVDLSASVNPTQLANEFSAAWNTGGGLVSGGVNEFSGLLGGL
jgi:uncharacterized protein YukE